MANKTIADDLLLLSTVMYDTYHNHLMTIANNKNLINQLIQYIIRLKDKNNDAFDTYYIGRRISINASEQQTFYNIIKLNQNDVISTIKTIPRFKEVNNLMDQFSFASMILLLCGCLVELKQINQAQFIYLFAYFRPYASRVSQIFQIIPNEDTIETMMNNISARFDLKREQSLFNCLKSMATNNFNGNFNGKTRKDILASKPTDHELWIIFQSSIWTAIGQFLKTIFVAHDKYKSIPTTYSHDIEVEDKDGDAAVINTANSEIDKKNKIIAKINKLFAMNPVDDRLARYAVNRSGLYTGNNVALGQLKTLIQRCLDNDQEKCNLLFTYIITAFLNTVNKSNNKKYTINELQSAMFSAKIYGIIYDTKNTIDPNKIEAKLIVNEMLNKYLDEFEFICKTYKDQYRKAFVLYCAAYIQKNG